MALWTLERLALLLLCWYRGPTERLWLCDSGGAGRRLGYWHSRLGPSPIPFYISQRSVMPHFTSPTPWFPRSLITSTASAIMSKTWTGLLETQIGSKYKDVEWSGPQIAPDIMPFLAGTAEVFVDGPL